MRDGSPRWPTQHPRGVHPVRRCAFGFGTAFKQVTSFHSFGEERSRLGSTVDYDPNLVALFFDSRKLLEL